MLQALAFNVAITLHSQPRVSCERLRAPFAEQKIII